MSRTRRFLHGAAHSGFSVFVWMAAWLVTGKLITQALPVAEVGLFGVLLAGSDFLILLLGVGIPVALPKLIAGAPEGERPAVLGAALAVTAALAGLGAVLLWGLALGVPVSARGGLPAFAQGAWPYLGEVSLLVSAGMLRDAIMAALAGFNAYAARSRAIIASALSQVVFAWAALYVLGGGLHGLLLSVAGGHVVGILAMLSGLPGLRAVRLERGHLRGCLRFSGPLYVNSLLTFFYARFDLLLAGAMLGMDAAGLYEAMKRIPAALSRVLGAMLTPYLPGASESIAAGDRGAAMRLMHRATAMTGMLGFGAVLLLLVFQERVARLLFTAAYLEGLGALAPLLLAQVVAVQTGIAGQTLIALGRPHWVTGANLLLPVSGLGLAALLLPRFGLAGAGFAALAAVLLSFGLQFGLVHRAGVRVQARAILDPLLAAAVCAVFWHAAGEVFFLRALAPVLFAAACLLVGVVTPAQWREMAGAFLPRARNGA